MSKKISEYFKVTPKSLSSADSTKKDKVLDESDCSRDNSSKIRNCQVIIKNQLPENLEIFEEISLNGSKINKTKLVKSELKKCKFCEKEMKSFRGFYYHIKSIHSDKINIFNC